MTKKLGAIAGVEGVHHHRFRHSFGTEVPGVGAIRSLVRNSWALRAIGCLSAYTKGVFKKAAAEAYLRAIGEASENEKE